MFDDRRFSRATVDFNHQPSFRVTQPPTGASVHIEFGLATGDDLEHFIAFSKMSPFSAGLEGREVALVSVSTVGLTGSYWSPGNCHFTDFIPVPGDSSVLISRWPGVEVPGFEGVTWKRFTETPTQD